MHRLTLIALALVLGLALAPGAAAGPPQTAAELALDCNDDGAVRLTTDLRIVGGVGIITQDCFVSMVPGASLTIRNATLTSACCLFVIGDAQRGSKLRVQGSTIDMAGPVQLAMGCCAGGSEPGRDETHGDVQVTDSLIRGETVEVSGSIAASDGKAAVKGSTLEATTTDPGYTYAVGVYASTGRASVDASRIVSNTGAIIATAAPGSTIATGNTFEVVGTVTITGGACTSSGNTPDIPCS